MKIALCYSGQLRHVKECVKNHKNTFFCGDNIDVFAHLWFDSMYEGKAFDEAHRNRGSFKKDDVDFFMNEFCPVYSIIEPPMSFSSELRPDPRFPHPINNTLSMFYSIKMSNGLKKRAEIENKFSYDYVVRLRTDEYFLSTIGSFDRYQCDSLHVLNEYAHLDYGINDHFCIGNSENMDKYCSVYDDFDKLYQMGAAINPECLLGFNVVIHHKLSVKKHDWKYKLFRDL